MAIKKNTISIQNIEDLYRTYENADILGTKKQATLSRVDNATSDMFMNLLSILYPKQGSALNGQQIFESIENFAGGSPEKSRVLAKLFRVYTTFINNKGENPLGNRIAEWYKQNGRPSAYTYFAGNASSGNKQSGSSYTSGNFDLMVPKLPNPDGADVGKLPTLTYLLVDAPHIDMKLRAADRAEAFLNYVPGVIASQLVPYLSAEFTLHRNATSATNRSLMTMSPLKFLLGADATTIPGRNNSLNANAMMFDAMTRNNWFKSPTIERPNYVAKKNAQEQARYEFRKRLKLEPNPQPKITPEVNNATPQPKPQGTFTTVTGMEMFTMPQTLINMDYDQTVNPRYQPVINPTLPFGSITDFSVNVQSSVGTFSFKTAKMTLKIFDRSRLVELADFINPKLYKATTIWVTYGWRAPSVVGRDAADDNPYFRFVNDNMLKREAYGVSNSGVQIDNNGVVTVTLSLFTQGGNEVIVSTPDPVSSGFDSFQQGIAADLKALQDLSAQLGLPAIFAAAPDIRGSVLMSSVNSGNLSQVDAATLKKELDGLTKAVESSKAAADVKSNFNTLINKLYAPANNVESELTKRANETSAERFSLLLESKDFFASPVEGKFAGDTPPITKHPLTDIAASMATGGPKKDIAEQSEAGIYGNYGENSFGKVFAAYFSSLAYSISGTVVDEFQVIFYKLNHRAGKARGLNIAEFPIDIFSLKNAYGKRIKQQKGDRMSFSAFLEIVRESQFGDMKNPAYGFRDLYAPDKNNGTLVAKDEAANATISARAIDNWGAEGPFMLPMVDFYIETLSNATGHSVPDLLEKYIIASNEADGTKKARGQTRIMRIHIYDRASTPHRTAELYMKAADGNGYVAVENDLDVQTGIRVTSDENAKAMSEKAGNLNQAKEEISKMNGSTGTSGQTFNQVESAINKALPGANVKYNFREIKTRGSDGTTPPSFDAIKKEVSRLVPTLLVGANGTMITNVNYSTNQDALLSTIMMLRNTSDAANPTEPNGAGSGDLPMRVVQGTMSLTTMGCPVLEYMQQFFVDLGTGTTADNLYNIVGLTHNITPSKFTTEMKLAFFDAYGAFEGTKSIVEGVARQINAVTAGVTAQSVRAEQKPKK